MKTKSARQKITSPIEVSRWAAYATAGAATALGCVATGEAAIVTTNVNQAFNASGPGASNIAIASFSLGAAGAYFGVFHGRGTTSGGSQVGFARLFVSSVGNAAFLGLSRGNYAYVAKLSAGANIAGGAFAAKSIGTFASGNGFAGSQWKTAGQGYVGFRFTDAAGTEYGWASVTADGTAAQNTFTLNSYAYTTAGEVITAGQTAVPEPSSLALLAAGGAGVLAWRQRRAKKAASAC